MSSARRATTLVEVLVAIAVVATLMGLLLPAVQQIRASASRAACANHVRQIGLALHQYHEANAAFPAGVTDESSRQWPRFLGWGVFLLPWVEQDALWRQSQLAFRSEPRVFRDPPHVGLATVIPLYLCPLDDRIDVPQYIDSEKVRVAFTSYLGIEGTDLFARDGTLFRGSRVSIADVTDGTSQTLLAGERPPSADLVYGWWYAGVGFRNTSSCDIVLGTRERFTRPDLYDCPAGPHHFAPGRLDNQCDMLHFWSLHPNGAHFLLADGSVRFLTYSADPIMPALATRARGEAVTVPE